MPTLKCPACGTENPEERKYCSKCFASLAGVPVPAGQPAAGAPLPPQPQAPRPTQPQNSRYLPDPEPVAKEPSGIPWTMIFLLVALVVGGLYYKYQASKPLPAPKVPAEQVVISFLEAKKTREFAKVKPYLSQNTLKKLDSLFASRQAKSAGFTRQDAENMMLWEVNPTAKDLKRSSISADRHDDSDQRKGTATVRVALQPLAKGPFDLPIMDVFFVCVQEGDQWKVDIMLSSGRDSQEGPLNIRP